MVNDYIKDYTVPHLLAYLHKNYKNLVESFEDVNSKYHDVYVQYRYVTYEKTFEFGMSISAIAEYLDKKPNADNVLAYKKELLELEQDLQEFEFMLNNEI